MKTICIPDVVSPALEYFFSAEKGPFLAIAHTALVDGMQVRLLTVRVRPNHIIAFTHFILQ